MMAAPASALELGELKIRSALGQPLRASIAYALNSREELYDFCVYLRPNLAADVVSLHVIHAVLFQLGVNYMQGHYVQEPEVVSQEPKVVVLKPETSPA